MRSKGWRSCAAVGLALLLVLGCGGATGGGDSELATSTSLNPFGQWLWTLSSPFGCPTNVEQEFPFLDMNNKVFNVIDEGGGNMSADFFDAAGNRVEMTGFWNSATGQVSATFCITETLAVEAGNGTFLCDAKGYVSDPALNTVVPYDLRTGEQINFGIDVGNDPWDMGVSPDGAYLLVPNRDSDSVSVIETATDTVVQTLSAGLFSSPTSAVFHPTRSVAFVSNQPVGDGSQGSYIRCLDTSQVPYSNFGTIDLNTFGPVTLCIGANGNHLAALYNNEGSMAIIDANLDQVITQSEPTVANPCQCEFTPDSTRLVVVGAQGMAIHDTALFNATENFDFFPIPGWDVAITEDGSRAYITTGDKGGTTVVSGVDTPPAPPPIRCFDLGNNVEITPGPSVGSPAYGIDACAPYMFYAETFRANVFHVPNHNIMNLAPIEVARFVRIAPQQPAPQPRIVKIDFTGFLSLLNQQVQLDGRSVVTQTIGFSFSCQAVAGDNTWIFIDGING